MEKVFSTPVHITTSKRSSASFILAKRRQTQKNSNTNSSIRQHIPNEIVSTTTRTVVVTYQPRNYTFRMKFVNAFYIARRRHVVVVFKVAQANEAAIF
mmetsp:Transcript_5850/g.7382  ORF Transcript_5850/g.7382 Transcript_5850/m.7382 type:complete len:98 (-) Transcript_5850:371-664(-)